MILSSSTTPQTLSVANPMMNHTHTHPFHHVLLTFDVLNCYLRIEKKTIRQTAVIGASIIPSPKFTARSSCQSKDGKNFFRTFQHISTINHLHIYIYPPLSTMIFIFNCPFSFGISQPATFEDTGIPSPTQPASHLEQWRLLARRLQAALVQTATRHEVWWYLRVSTCP